MHLEKTGFLHLYSLINWIRLISLLDLVWIRVLIHLFRHWCVCWIGCHSDGMTLYRRRVTLWTLVLSAGCWHNIRPKVSYHRENIASELFWSENILPDRSFTLDASLFIVKHGDIYLPAMWQYSHRLMTSFHWTMASLLRFEPRESLTSPWHEALWTFCDDFIFWIFTNLGIPT